jgi:hypothetical protein
LKEQIFDKNRKNQLREEQKVTREEVVALEVRRYDLPDPGACRSSATHRRKALNKSYKFSLDLIPIGGLNKEL